MQFLKKHYEKILLSTVLTLLAVAAGWLSIQAKVEQENIALAVQDIVTAPPSPVEPLKFDKFDAATKKLQNPPTLDLVMSNHVFNPVKWVETPPPDQKLIPLRTGEEIGPGALEIKRLAPLTLSVVYEGPVGAEPVKYSVLIMNQGDPTRRNSTTPQKYQVASTNERPNRAFATKAIKGSGADAELTLELKDDAEMITISKSKPYSRVVGYAADLFYKHENLNFPARRKDDEIGFSGDKYKIVAIKEKEVVLEAVSNGKRYTIKDKSP